MIKVSVIVPVYNIESYLRECLDSLINQTLKEIEIICIDDCSTDNSYSILEEYAKKSDKIKVIKNDYNKGNGYTRNVGIRMSLGEYIGFIDSDDYVSKDYFENLYNTAKKYNSDITSTLNIKIYEMHNNKIKHFYYKFKKKEYESKWCLNDIENAFSYNVIAPYVWNKIYRRQFLLEHNIEFINEHSSFAEDTNFTIKYMGHRPKTSFNNKSIIYYRKREGSLTSIKSKKSVISVINNMCDVLKYYEDNFEELSDKIYYKIWMPVINFYASSSDFYKEEFYNDVLNFAKRIRVREHHINRKSLYDNYAYDSYLSLISSRNYNDYLYRIRSLRRLESIENGISSLDRYFKIFAINNSEYYFTIIILGVKISFKKRWTII